MADAPFETLHMGRGDWLEFRRSHVGGSDVAAILGLSPWRTAYQVWAEKTGLAEPEDISDRPRVEWGTRLEDALAMKFADSHPGLDLHRPEPGDFQTFVPRERPWAMATLDGIAWEGGAPSVVEFKTAHYPGTRDWGETGDGAKGVPAHYLAQVAHYLSVTGWERAYVAVLIDGWDYREYSFGRREADPGYMAGKVDAFWRDNVEGRVPPEVTGGDGAALLAVHDEPDGDFVDGDYSQFALVEEWREALDRARTAKGEADAKAARLKAYIGDHAGLAFPEGRLSWTRSTSSRFDSKALREDDPDIYARYVREAPVQRLTWKGAE